MKQPAVFFGHGTPTNALGGPYADEWRALGASLPRPKAILCVSAHWYVPALAVTATQAPRTIHDFYGFPPELYQIFYPAPGAPWLAERVSALTGAALDEAWGLDHGSWSVLKHVFPEADVPVIQLSIDTRADAPTHVELGRKLAVLRAEGVMIMGSGDVVHNLRAMRREGGPPFDWAQRFHDRVKSALEAHDDAFLAAPQGEDAALSIPTPEHYLPLLYVLGARGENEAPHFFTDRIDLASVSMLGVRFG
ncbi:MAG: 4,5-DOPA dioxygenase extradiol [Hyphomonadaceae bacterium]|nr:4,5-DOPA dioxygenase extradiol [Hyphomonadaceae bacterium]